MKIVNAEIITPGGVLNNGVIIIQNDKITYVGDSKNAPAYDGFIYDAKGFTAGPGFVDMHCHGGGEWWAHENPSGIGLHHLKGGTTSLLCSFWRNAVEDGIPESVNRVKDAMQNDNPGNIRGIHMEGPYLNPSYGSAGGKEYPVDRRQYLSWMELGDGIIKYWTVDPEQEGSEEFAKECHKRGIVLGICYSEASIPLIEKFKQYGLNIGTHIMCGAGHPPTLFKGTREPGSDEYVLDNDDMFAEVIADSVGAHLRPIFLSLIYKLKGYKGTVIITDCCTGGETMGSDANIIDGALYGSRLRMNVACRNMKKHTGATVWEIFQMASANPARAIGIYDKYGSVEAGKNADIVITDQEFNIKDVILSGRVIKL